jgi:hypothetical protein
MSKEEWLEGAILTFKKKQRLGLIKYDNGKYCIFVLEMSQNFLT